MNRRGFLLSSLAPLAVARAAWAQHDGWRTFEVTTRVEIPRAAGITRAWLPLAYAGGPGYQRVLKQIWRGSANTLRAVRDERTGTGILFAEWAAADATRQVELTLQIATRRRSVEWRDRTMRGAPASSVRRYLQPTGMLPLDGSVADTARRLTHGETDDVAKARAIYESVVDAGLADRANLRFVQLCRAAAVPARTLSGIRLAPGDVTRAQEIRVEFHSARHGWVAVDPAAVKSEYDRRRLFGSWEGDWVAFNDAHDVRLPGSTGPAVPFLLHPHAESAGTRLDSRDPETFRYRITARDIS